MAEDAPEQTPKNVIRNLMDKHRITSYSKLAAKAGLDPSTVIMFANGRNKGRETTLKALAQALDVPVETFDAWKDLSASERGKQGGRGKESSRLLVNGAAAYAKVGVSAPAFTL